jgi:hypothetical protein
MPGSLETKRQWANGKSVRQAYSSGRSRIARVTGTAKGWVGFPAATLPQKAKNAGKWPKTRPRNYFAIRGVILLTFRPYSDNLTQYRDDRMTQSIAMGIFPVIHPAICRSTFSRRFS